MLKFLFQNVSTTSSGHQGRDNPELLGFLLHERSVDGKDVWVTTERHYLNFGSEFFNLIPREGVCVEDFNGNGGL